MVDAPEKIWIEQDDCPYFYVESELTEVGSPVTKYIRSDLVAELEVKNEWLKHALEAANKRADEAEGGRTVRQERIEKLEARLLEVLAANKRAEALVETLKHEAQLHAQEARTANATIAEIYREVSGGKGEPGNWNGAEPVRAELAALRAQVAVMQEALEIIAGKRQCLDNLMGNKDVALAALKAASHEQG